MNAPMCGITPPRVAPVPRDPMTVAGELRNAADHLHALADDFAAGFDRNARGFRGEPGRVATHSEIPAPRSIAAMVTPRGTPDAPETRVFGVAP